MFFGKKQPDFMSQPMAGYPTPQQPPYGVMPEQGMGYDPNAAMPGMGYDPNQYGVMAGMPDPGMGFDPNQYGAMPGMPTPGMPYEAYDYSGGPYGMAATRTHMGYTCDACGYCAPYCEHTALVEKMPEIYVVKKGDTVYKIAKKYGLDWRELAGYNHLGQPDLIYPGERLFIPPRY